MKIEQGKAQKAVTKEDCDIINISKSIFQKTQAPQTYISQVDIAAREQETKRRDTYESE